MKGITLEEAYREYRNNKLSDGYSENTLLIYDWTIGEMIRVLDNPPIAEVTLQDLRKFMLYFRVEYRTQQGKPLSGSSLENAWKGIRSLFGWAALTLGIERPDRDLPRPRYTSREVEPFTMEEVKKLLDACMYTRMSTGDIRKPYKRRRGTGPRDKALILLTSRHRTAHLGGITPQRCRHQPREPRYLDPALRIGTENKKPTRPHWKTQPVSFMEISDRKRPSSSRAGLRISQLSDPHDPRRGLSYYLEIRRTRRCVQRPSSQV
jgi:integrase